MSRRTALSKPTRPRTWSEFKRWCAARGLKPLPAHAWTIAAYLRWVDRREGARGARQALDAIAREHLLKTVRSPARHPIVERTLALIERRDQVRAQHAALFDERDILDTSPPTPPDAQDGAGEPDEEAGPRRARRMLSAQPKLRRKRPGGSG